MIAILLFLVTFSRAYTHAPRLGTVAPGASLIASLGQSYKYEVCGVAIHSLLAMRVCSYEARLVTEQRVTRLPMIHREHLAV